jgi:hypothetical protein
VGQFEVVSFVDMKELVPNFQEEAPYRVVHEDKYQTLYIELS